MSKVVIVYCHPYDGSFNHAELEAIKSNMENHQLDYSVIDLYKDKFNPAYDADELRLFSRGQTLDPLVSRYQDMISHCEGLVFISPIWWSDIPAMLKGFIDKVMKTNFAYKVTNLGLRGMLINIKWAQVFTTSTTPNIAYQLKILNNAAKSTFAKGTLHQIGIKSVGYHNFGGITGSKLSQRQHYLASLAKMNINL